VLCRYADRIKDTDLEHVCYIGHCALLQSMSSPPYRCHLVTMPVVNSTWNALFLYMSYIAAYEPPTDNHIPRTWMRCCCLWGMPVML
jgi:hypothetical protein